MHHCLLLFCKREEEENVQSSQSDSQTGRRGGQTDGHIAHPTGGNGQNSNAKAGRRK